MKKTYCLPFCDQVMAITAKTLLIMRLTVVIMMAACLQVSAKGEAQTISITLRNTSLEKVFKEIHRQAGYQFFYQDEVLQQARKFDIDVKNASIKVVLEWCFKDQPLNFTIKGKTINVLQKVEASVSNAPPALVQINVVGRVTDNMGDAMAGVSVSIAGEKKGVTTDEKGYFSISVPENASLSFSYVGFKTITVSVNGKTNLQITLTPENAALNDVVVVGYGTVKKKDLTGSISSVKEEDIKSTPVVALDRALQGRVAGVAVTTNSAKPGGGTTIRIRGTGSVNAGNEPLYVIDGFPTGNLNSINPGDIVSMEILKDASATAIYGSRGSNGVVLVTTQRGKAGQSNINFDSYYGEQSILHKIPLLNAREYAEFINEARLNGGGTAYFDGSTENRPLPSSFGKGTDWQDEVFRKAPIQNYQLSFSGGEQKTKYSISGGYYDQKGIILNSYFKRYTIRANLDRDVSSRFKVGLSMQAARTSSNSSRTETDGGANGGVTNAALNYAPTFGVYNSDGTYYRDVSSLNGSLVDNPVGLAKEITDQFLTTRVLTNVYGEYTIIKGFTFRTSWGADQYNTKSSYYATRLIGLGAKVGGTASIGNASYINWLNENTLTYNKTFLNKHTLSALLGYTTQAYETQTVTANAANFNDDFDSYNNLGAGASLVASASGFSEWSLISYLARINYGYDSRYLFTFTARTDGSSRFGPRNKYGFFPSGAFAWRISNEKFMKSITFLNDLKLRTSYGVTGNQEIGDYGYYSTIQSAYYAFGGLTNSVGSVPGGIGNEGLRWEKNVQMDIGLDAGFFDDRIQLTVDYYNKKTEDLLFNVNVPQTTGYSTALQNIGKVENSGMEFAVNAQIIRQKDFSWSSAFNIAFNKNKVLTLNGNPSITTGEGSGHLQISNTVLLAVGQPLGNFYGRKMDGIFQTQAEIDKSAQPTAAPGDIRYKDVIADGAINDNDRVVIGNGSPSFFGGFNNTFNYKGWMLTVFVQGSYGNDILNFGRFGLYNLNGSNNQSKDVLNRWTATNPSKTIPRANSAGGQRILSSFHIEDGSYLRVKNIMFGYNLSARVLKAIGIKTARVYMAAQNPFTITHYKGYDPEVSRFGTTSISQGMDYGGYPSAKSFLLGLNFNF